MSSFRMRARLGVCFLTVGLLCGTYLGQAWGKTTLVFWTSDLYSEEGNAAIQRSITQGSYRQL